MDSQNHFAPELSGNPEAELSVLIHRALKLQEETLAVSHRIKELHEQISQQRDAARNLAPPMMGAQGDR